MKFIILPQGDVRRDHEQEHRQRVGGELRVPGRKWIVLVHFPFEKDLHIRYGLEKVAFEENRKIN